MNKRIICIVLLPFCMGCFLRLKGNALYMVLCALFSCYLMIPALLLKDRRKKELLIRGVVITAMFLLGFLRASVESNHVLRVVAGIQNGEHVMRTGLVTNEKNDGSAIYMDDYLVYLSDTPVFDAEGEEIAGIKPGDVVRVEGKTYLFDRATNEGEFDSYEYYISQKIYYRITAEKIILIKRPAFSASGFMWDLKGKIRDVYVRNLPPVQSALVCAMALGDKTFMNDELKDLFRVSGLSHILVISGLHISLIGLVLYRLLQGRTAIVTACVMAACGLIFYGAVTGFSVSTVRAVAMFVMYLSAAALGCGYDGICAWSMALFGMLMNEPTALYGSGFIMSFYQTGFIMCMNELKGTSFDSEKNRTRMEKDPLKKLRYRFSDMLKAVTEALKFTFIMTLSSYPLIACYYYELPAYSTAANFLLLPAMGFVMVSAIVGGAAGLIFPWTAGFFLYPVKVILGADTFFCEQVKKLPGAIKICGYPGKIRLMVYFSVLSIMLLIFFRGRKKMMRYTAVCLCSMCLLILIMFPHRLKFEMDFLDVGQGDGIFISTSEGGMLFVDGGSSSKKNVGKNILMPFLKYKGVEKIDYWFLSHLDSDHYNGFVECLRAGYEVGTIVLAEGIVRDESFDELMREADNAGVNVMFVKCGDSLVLSDTVIKVLSPDDSPETDDKNARSMVLVYSDDSVSASYGESDTHDTFKAFLGGDIDCEVEHDMLDKKLLKDITLYKASHHGSKYSNSLETLRALDPEIAVISCSLTNKYGHPGAEVVENMEMIGAEIYYTMYSGRIRVTEHKGRPVVSTFR